MISTASAVAFAMELNEYRLLKGVDTGGLDLSWGNGEAILGLIQQIAFREKLGRVLAEGVKPVSYTHLTNITFAFSNLAALINYSATFAVGFIFSLYLQVVRGYDAQAAGMILLIQPAVQAMLSPYAGALSCLLYTSRCV